MSLTTTVAKGAGAISGAVGVPAAAVGTYLYVTSLYEVEKEVIEKNVKLTVNATNSNANPVIIATEVNSDNTNSDANKLLHGHSWTCEITVESTEDNQKTTEITEVVSKLKAKLPTSNGTDHLENKKLLVKACSKDRKEKATDKLVVGQLKVVATGSGTKTYSFKNHTELNDLLKAN